MSRKHWKNDNSGLADFYFRLKLANKTTESLTGSLVQMKANRHAFNVALIKVSAPGVRFFPRQAKHEPETWLARVGQTETGRTDPGFDVL